MQFSYNTAVHSTTKFSPFELTYGRTPKIPIDLIMPDESLDLFLDEESYASGVKSNLGKAFGMVAKNTESKMMKAKLRHDRDVVAADFEVGGFVWMHDTTTKKGKCKKLSAKYKESPFRVMERIDDATYKVKQMGKKKIFMVNKCGLKRCYRGEILKKNEIVEESQIEIPEQGGNTHLKEKFTKSREVY
jgi:hypothetical protein